MRSGLLVHRKFLRLAHVLRSRALAAGSLALLWESAYQGCTDLIGDADDLEAVADWQGEPGTLAAAMLNCGGGGAGFVERRDDGRLYVHDLWEHAPPHVRRRAGREDARRAEGREIREIRAEAGRKGAAATWQTASHLPSTDEPVAKESAPEMANGLTGRGGEGKGREVVVDPPLSLDLSPVVVPTVGSRARAREQPAGAPAHEPIETKPARPARLTVKRLLDEVPIPEELDTEAFREAWEARLRERSEARRLPTLGAATAQLRKLARITGEFGIDGAIELVELATASGYEGIVFADTPERLRKARAAKGAGSRSVGNAPRIVNGIDRRTLGQSKESIEATEAFLASLGDAGKGWD